jgi:uncharacterized Zn finger protein (UPF0148 family)
MEHMSKEYLKGGIIKNCPICGSPLVDHYTDVAEHYCCSCGQSFMVIRTGMAMTEKYYELRLNQYLNHIKEREVL